MKFQTRKQTSHVVIHRAEIWSGSDYHFVIRRDGSVLDLVPFPCRGEHALNYNGRSVGVAVEGDFAGAERAVHGVPTPEQIASVETVCRQLLWWYGPLKFVGHSELGWDGTRYPEKLQAGHTCPGERFPLDELRKTLSK